MEEQSQKIIQETLQKKEEKVKKEQVLDRIGNGGLTFPAPGEACATGSTTNE